MILYIAGPMTGLPELNYPAFIEAQRRLEAAGYFVNNPVDVDRIHNKRRLKMSWDWYMRHTIRMLLNSDGVALLPDWENSKGAKLEVRIADDLGIPLQTVDKWANEMTEGEAEILKQWSGM